MPNIKLTSRRPPVPFNQLTIGQRIQWLLLVKKLSQTAVAQRAGLTQPALANIMGDHRKPSAASLLKLPRALDSHPEFIFYGDGPPTSWATPEDDIQNELLNLYRGLRNREQQQLMVYVRMLARVPNRHLRSTDKPQPKR